MKLDRELIRDIKKQANGDGSRKVKMAFLKRVRDTKKSSFYSRCHARRI